MSANLLNVSGKTTFLLFLVLTGHSFAFEQTKSIELAQFIGGYENINKVCFNVSTMNETTMETDSADNNTMNHWGSTIKFYVYVFISLIMSCAIFVLLLLFWVMFHIRLARLKNMHLGITSMYASNKSLDKQLLKQERLRLLEPRIKRIWNKLLLEQEIIKTRNGNGTRTLVGRIISFLAPCVKIVAILHKITKIAIIISLWILFEDFDFGIIYMVEAFVIATIICFEVIWYTLNSIKYWRNMKPNAVGLNKKLYNLGLAEMIIRCIYFEGIIMIFYWKYLEYESMWNWSYRIYPITIFLILIYLIVDLYICNIPKKVNTAKEFYTINDLKHLLSSFDSSLYDSIEYVGRGSFGTVYSISSKKNLAPNIAIKIEQLKTDKNLHLHNEYLVLKSLLNDSDCVGIPRVYNHGKINGNKDGLSMELLGLSLNKLFKQCNKQFLLKCVLMIADQLLQRIEYIHNKGYIHRDLKPSNILLGTGYNDNILYITDFGLAKQYMIDNKHIPFKNNYKTIIGTVTFCSLNSHLGMELSRRDDLESLGYMLIYLLKGKLPWNNKDFTRKLTIEPRDLCEGCPDEFSKYIMYCWDLKFDEKPDYSYLRNEFRKLFIRNNYHSMFVFDWKLLELEQNQQFKKLEDDKLKPKQTPKVKNNKSRRHFFGILLLLLGLSLGVVSWWFGGTFLGCNSLAVPDVSGYVIEDNVDFGSELDGRIFCGETFSEILGASTSKWDIPNGKHGVNVTLKEENGTTLSSQVSTNSPTNTTSPTDSPTNWTTFTHELCTDISGGWDCFPWGDHSTEGDSDFWFLFRVKDTRFIGTKNDSSTIQFWLCSWEINPAVSPTLSPKWAGKNSSETPLLNPSGPTSNVLSNSLRKSPSNSPSSSPSVSRTGSPSNNPTEHNDMYICTEYLCSTTGWWFGQDSIIPTKYPTQVPIRNPTKHPTSKLAATCNMDTSFTIDFITFGIKDVLPSGLGLNVTGKSCPAGSTVKFHIQPRPEQKHLHIGSSVGGCSCDIIEQNSTHSEDNFGGYGIGTNDSFNPAFTCTVLSTCTPTKFPSLSTAPTPNQNSTYNPATSPTEGPTYSPTYSPTGLPIAASQTPSDIPTHLRSNSPSPNRPTGILSPVNSPASIPTSPPTDKTFSPTKSPTKSPSSSPTNSPSNGPTEQRNFTQIYHFIIVRYRCQHDILACISFIIISFDNELNPSDTPPYNTTNTPSDASTNSASNSSLNRTSICTISNETNLYGCNKQSNNKYLCTKYPWPTLKWWFAQDMDIPAKNTPTKNPTFISCQLFCGYFMLIVVILVLDLFYTFSVIKKLEIWPKCLWSHCTTIQYQLFSDWFRWKYGPYILSLKCLAIIAVNSLCYNNIPNNINSHFLVAIYSTLILITPITIQKMLEASKPKPMSVPKIKSDTFCDPAVDICHRGSHSCGTLNYKQHKQLKVVNIGDGLFKVIHFDEEENYFDDLTNKSDRNDNKSHILKDSTMPIVNPFDCCSFWFKLGIWSVIFLKTLVCSFIAIHCVMQFEVVMNDSKMRWLSSICISYASSVFIIDPCIKFMFLMTKKVYYSVVGNGSVDGDLTDEIEMAHKFLNL